jgi:predicted transcriptional regulator
MSRQPAKSAQRMAATVFLLIKAPRTAADIAQLLGIVHGEARKVVTGWLQAFEDEGLIERQGDTWRWLGVPE